MKRLTVAMLVAGIIGGCNLRNEQKIEAAKRWRRAQSRVICGLGCEHLKVGELDNARASALEALTRDPDYAPARILLAKVWLEKGRYTEAGKELRKAEELQPQDPEIAYLLGVASEKRGEHAEALKCYQKARQLDPTNDAYVTASAEVLVAMGRKQDALELLEARLQRSDDDASVLSLAGEVAMLLGQPGKAVKYYQRCLDLHPDSCLARENLTKACFFDGQYAEALVNLKKLTARPDYGSQAAWLHVMTGDSHMALNQPGLAKIAYEAAASVDPGAAPIWARLAKAAMASGDIPAASAAARQALALTDSCLEATIVLGYAMLRQGQARGASELLAAAAQKHPDDATLQCTLGRCYAALGKTDEAVDCYRKALKSDPAHPLARSLLVVAQEPKKLQ